MCGNLFRLHSKLFADTFNACDTIPEAIILMCVQNFDAARNNDNRHRIPSKHSKMYRCVCNRFFRCFQAKKGENSYLYFVLRYSRACKSYIYVIGCSGVYIYTAHMSPFSSMLYSTLCVSLCSHDNIHIYTL